MLLNSIHFRNLRGDLFGGVTAAIVSLPLALAFGVASGAGPMAGLYGAIIVGLFAALFGGTPALISEPTGPMTVVMAAVVTRMIASDPEHGLALAFTVVMLAGLFQILFGLMRLGKYITLMPYSVVSGFMSGIGVILIILQIAPFLGQPSPTGGVLGTLTALPQLLSRVNPMEMLLGALTLAILFAFPRRWRRVAPGELVALVVGTAVSLLFFAEADLRRIGALPTGLPSLHWPTFTPGLFTIILMESMVLGLLGSIDALLTAVIASSLTRSEYDANKELVAQGIGNFSSGLLGGLPGAGATMGTVVNIQAGGRTALSGVVRALVLLAVVLGASRLTAPIPLAVLAGIAIKVGLNILDWSFLKRAHNVSHRAALVMYGVLLLTVFVDLVVAVGVGVFIANVLTIERLSELQARNVKAISDADDEVPLLEEEKQLLDQGKGRVLLFYLSGPMVFGVAKAIAREHDVMRRYESIIFDLSNVSFLDVTVSLAIENSIKDTLDAGRRVYLVFASEEVSRQMRGLGILSRLPPDGVHTNRLAALETAVGVNT